MSLPATDRRWETAFGRWIKKYNVMRLVDDMRRGGHSLTPSAVYYWLRGSAVPRPDKACALVRLSNGALTLEDIYAHTQEMKGVSCDKSADQCEEARA